MLVPQTLEWCVGSCTSSTQTVSDSAADPCTWWVSILHLSSPWPRFYLVSLCVKTVSGRTCSVVVLVTKLAMSRYCIGMGKSIGSTLISSYQYWHIQQSNHRSALELTKCTFDCEMYVIPGWSTLWSFLIFVLYILFSGIGIWYRYRQSGTRKKYRINAYQVLLSVLTDIPV